MNEEKNRYFTVTDQKGETIEYEILFTFDSEETKKAILFLLIIVKMKLEIL